MGRASVLSKRASSKLETSSHAAADAAHGFGGSAAA
jgi:hypothetical protein